MSAMTSRFRGCAGAFLGAVVLPSAPMLAQGPTEGVADPPGERLRTRGDATITIPGVERPRELADFVTARGGLLAQRPGAPAADFRQRKPGDGVPVSHPTTAYLSYDDANLYVVFVCQDEPGKVRASVARREEIGADDQVVVYLDTFHDRE